MLFQNVPENAGKTAVLTAMPSAGKCSSAIRAFCLCLTWFLCAALMCLYVNAADAAGESSASASDPGLTIITASDLHHLSEELTDDGEAFMNLLDNADGKITQYSTQIIETWIDDVIAQDPDAVILTGDLTFNGEKLSHQDLAARLGRLEQAGIPVLVLPGNHDLNNSSARRFSGDQMAVAESITADDFASIYSQFGYEEAASRDSASLSYVYQLRDDLEVLCIDVNTADSPYFLKEETLSWIEDVLRQARENHCTVLGASHQNLMIHNWLFYDGYQMGRADRLASLYQEYGVSVHLSGHMHVQHIAQENGVTDIATSALTVAPAQYGILQIGEDLDTFSYRTKVISDSALVSFAHDYFCRCTERKTRAQLASHTIPDQIREQMISQTVQINYAYFSGRMDLIDDAQELLALWQTWAGDSFMQIYLMSLTEDDTLANETAVSGDLHP